MIGADLKGPNGTVSNGKVFFDMTGAPGEDALDGMKVDRQGSLYVQVRAACGSCPLPASIWDHRRAETSALEGNKTP